MIDKVIYFSKAVAMLAMTAYLLVLLFNRFKPKPPPCDTCKHLARKYRSGRMCWICAKSELYGTYHYDNLKYCRGFEPRKEREESDDG